MSELFKWLNKTERGMASSQVADILDARSQIATPRDLSVPANPPTERDEIYSPMEHPAPLADQKIRSVLEVGTMPGEQFRFLRARLGQLQRQQGFKKILVTSSVPGEGKTFVACSLASILAQEPGKRVLLIDADLRMPRTPQEFGLEKDFQSVGFTQILQGKHELRANLVRLVSLNLFYIPAGEIPQNPSELLASDNLEKSIGLAAELFDWIIIDSPPILNVADPTNIAPFCDTVVLVIQANKTPTKLIQKSVQTIGRSSICGIVINRAEIHRRSNYYYQYYYQKNGSKK